MYYVVSLDEPTCVYPEYPLCLHARTPSRHPHVDSKLADNEDSLSTSLTLSLEEASGSERAVTLSAQTSVAGSCSGSRDKKRSSNCELANKVLHCLWSAPRCPIRRCCYRPPSIQIAKRGLCSRGELGRIHLIARINRPRSRPQSGAGNTPVLSLSTALTEGMSRSAKEFAKLLKCSAICRDMAGRFRRAQAMSCEACLETVFFGRRAQAIQSGSKRAHRATKVCRESFRTVQRVWRQPLLPAREA